MNLTIDSINPTVLNNFICLPTYAILFILYDFSIRQHTADNVSNHLQSSINFIVSESQIPSNIKLPFYETQQSVRDPRVIQPPPYSMPIEPIASYSIPPAPIPPPTSTSPLSSTTPYDYYYSSSYLAYDNNNSNSYQQQPLQQPSPLHVIPPHPLPQQSHNTHNNNSSTSSSSSSSSTHSIYNNNNNLKSSNDDLRSRSRSPPRHPSSPVHLPYELDVYYRDLIRTVYIHYI